MAAVINVMAALEHQQTVKPVQILELTLQVVPVPMDISIRKLLSALSVSHSVYRANTSQIFVLLAQLLVLMHQPVFAHKVENSSYIIIIIRLFYRLK
jgi:hypothetical protein